MITLKDVRENPEVDALIRGAQKQLNAMGYTEHGHRHISIVSKRAGDILEKIRISRKNSRVNKDSRIYT